MVLWLSSPLCHKHAMYFSFLAFICRERSEKSLLTWEKVEECALETAIVDKVEVKFFLFFLF